MPQLRTVQQAFEIIKRLEWMDGAGPTALSRELDLPKSTVHDYLRTLATTEYVVESEGEYRLSYHFLSTGKRLQYRNKLYHVANLELRSLSEDIGENVNIGIIEDNQWVLLRGAHGNPSFDLGDYTGIHTPLHTHAAGKAILAHLPKKQRDAYLNRDLESMTEHTITDREQLRTETEEIREAGYAVDSDQQVVGMGVVASPVLVDGNVISSVAVTCPSGRLDGDEYRDKLTRKVHESADAISVSYVYGSFSRD